MIPVTARRRTARGEGAAVELDGLTQLHSAPGGGTDTVSRESLTGMRPGHRWPPRPDVLRLALWAAGAAPRSPASGGPGRRLAAGAVPGPAARRGGSADDALARALCAVRAARARQRLGRHAEATALADTALWWARRAGSEPERIAALHVLGVSLWHGPEPVATAVFRLRALLEEHGDGRPEARLALAGPLAVLYGMQERRAAARTALAEAHAGAAELGTGGATGGGVLLSVLTARVESLTGRRRPAVRLLEAAADEADSLGLGRLRDAARWAVVRVLTDADRYEEAAHRLPVAGPWTVPTGGPGRSARAAWSARSVHGAGPAGLAARIAAVRGCAGEALALAERAVGEAEATDSPVVQALARLDQAEVFRLTGRRGEARRAVSLAGCGFARKGHVAGVGVAAARHAALAPEAVPAG